MASKEVNGNEPLAARRLRQVTNSTASYESNDGLLSLSKDLMEQIKVGNDREKELREQFKRLQEEHAKQKSTLESLATRDAGVPNAKNTISLMKKELDTERSAGKERQAEIDRLKSEIAALRESSSKISNENRRLVKHVAETENKFATQQQKLSLSSSADKERLTEIDRLKSEIFKLRETSVERFLENQKQQEQIVELRKQVEIQREIATGATTSMERIIEEKLDLELRLAAISEKLSKETERLTRAENVKGPKERAADHEGNATRQERQNEAKTRRAVTFEDAKQDAAERGKTRSSTDNQSDEEQKGETTSPASGSSLCPICANWPRDTAYVPCGHTVCNACAEHWNNEPRYHCCPICKGDVTDSMQVRF